MPSSFRIRELSILLAAVLICPVASGQTETSATSEKSEKAEVKETTEPAPNPAPGSPEPPPITEADTRAAAQPSPTKEAKAESPSLGRYSRPLLFPPEDNDIRFTSPQVKWDLSGGARLNFGGLIVESGSIKIFLNQVKRADVPRHYRDTDRSDALVTNISFRWPNLLTKTGTLSIESSDGKVLFSREILEDTREDWADNLNSRTEKILKPHVKSQFGILDVETGPSGFLKSGAQLRFCLARKNTEAEKIRICSNLHTVSRAGDKMKLVSVDEGKEADVALAGSSIGPRGMVNFPEGKAIDIKVRFTDGSTIALTSRPLVLKFLDVVRSKDGESVVLTGQGAQPIGKVKVVSVPPNHFWSATGIEQEIIWELTVPLNQPFIRVLGAWNVPFTYLFKYEDLPSENDRVYLSTRTGSGTYVNGARLHILAPAQAKVVSKEDKIQRYKQDEYIWKFRARRRGENNKSKLLVQAENAKDRAWAANYQLYRGYPYEFSTRLTGIVAANLETVFIGEIATSAWFESLFGLDSYYLSEKRWGMSMRYFRALQSFAFASEDLNLSEFSVANADLKYNLRPGIWNRDELFGLIGSVEMVKVAGLDATLAGGGFFWARTMPKIFNDLFNLFWFFRYPKYVDVEFLYYPLSANPIIIPGSSYNLNFHGKVFWSQRVYGEAGFGIKQFNFTDNANPEEAQQVVIGTAYGTVGLGIVF